MVQEIIDILRKRHNEKGLQLGLPASGITIERFERAFGKALPLDFRNLYLYCDGFQIDEDQFHFLSLDELLSEKHFGTDWFYFAEYMTFSDMWGVRILADKCYEIFNPSQPDVVLTKSLAEFLNRLAAGHVFDKGGLADWLSEVSS